MAGTLTILDPRKEKEFKYFRHLKPDDGILILQAQHISTLTETKIVNEIIEYLSVGQAFVAGNVPEKMVKQVEAKTNIRSAIPYAFVTDQFIPNTSLNLIIEWIAQNDDYHDWFIGVPLDPLKWDWQSIWGSSGVAFSADFVNNIQQFKLAIFLATDADGFTVFSQNEEHFDSLISIVTKGVASYSYENELKSKPFIIRFLSKILNP